MAFAEGNQFWKLRASSGAPRKYKTPEALWADCVEYFEHRNQWQWNGTPVPYTQISLCLFLDIATVTWAEWGRDGHDLSGIVTRVNDIIRDQKMTGATVGAFNHNIIARELGLADKSEHSGSVEVKTIERRIVRSGD